METLKKIVYVPSNHKLQFELMVPVDFPPGETEVVIILVPKSTPQVKDKNEFLKLAGKLKNSPNFKGDPLKLQRKLRDEWED